MHGFCSAHDNLRLRRSGSRCGSRSRSLSTCQGNGNTEAKLSVAALGAKLQTMTEEDRRRWGSWFKDLDSVALSDIPKVLACLDKNPARSVRDQFRWRLLERWVKSDPKAAMAYANTITNTQSRNRAIMEALQGSLSPASSVTDRK